MRKFLFLFLILCIVSTGTLWIKKYRVSEVSLDNTNDSLVIQLVHEAGEAFFLRQLPSPDPEAVSRFQKAIDREIERLNAIQRQAKRESRMASSSGTKPSTFVP